MKCDKVRKLLLTDHTDGEGGGRLREEAERHLAGCEACRQFYALLNEKAVMPFKRLRPVEAPEEVWEGIKQKLYGSPLEEERVDPISALWGLMPVRRAALAAVSLVFAVFMLSGVHAWRLYDRSLTRQYMEMQFYYFTEGDTEAMNDGFGTAIEEFLL